MHKLILTFLLCIICNLFSNAQNGIYYPAKHVHDWWQADMKKDSLPGISLDQAYELLKGRKSKTVIVAVIDNCIDTSHIALRGKIWTNKKEIASNGIDDDHNGFVDDLHGWCFVCGKNNVSQNLESEDEVRTYVTWRQKFEGIDTSKLERSLKIQYNIYKLSKKRIFDKYRFYELGSMMRTDTALFLKYIDNLLPLYKDSILINIPFTALAYSNPYDSLENYFWAAYIQDKKLSPIVNRPLGVMSQGLRKPGFLNKHFFGITVGLDNKIYDTTQNYRLVVGDDDNDFKTLYGSPNIDVPGHSNTHATPIAGIIAATRQTDEGMRGIADNVLLMPVIIGKNGPARDKDMVFAIHYAVDNGASIINISIGGSPYIGEHVKEIMEAFDYASLHGVLIINSAGNEGVNMDNESYNLGQGINGKEHEDYIRVGNNTYLQNDSLVSYDSNFGDKTVDLFAPGTAIYTTAPGNKYESVRGTSFSGPVVAGVAALLKEYFPTLTAVQIKEILMKSVYKPDVMVTPPLSSGIEKKISFGKMSKSGGIVNAYNAVKLADEMTKKK